MHALNLREAAGAAIANVTTAEALARAEALLAAAAALVMEAAPVVIAAHEHLSAWGMLRYLNGHGVDDDFDERHNAETVYGRACALLRVVNDLSYLR